MSLYSDSEYPVAAGLQELHARQLDALGEPGTWFTGIERVALAEEVRAARIEAGVQEADDVPAPVADGGASPLQQSVLRGRLRCHRGPSCANSMTRPWKMD